MKHSNRNLIVVLKGEIISEQAIEQEVESLHDLLYSIESTDHFCVAHELVDRNRITSRPSKIIRESRYQHLRAFRFLINKN